MEITRDKSIERWAYDEARTEYNSEREGIHLTDLLYPLKFYWGKKKPLPPTDEEMLYYTSGSAIEHRFLRAIGYLKGETREWGGIKYSVDLFHNFPCEIKTRRRWLAKEGEEERTYDNYLRQLKGYCAVSGTSQGWLIIISMVERDGEKTKPEMACYRVNFTVDELESMKIYLLEIRKILEGISNGELSISTLKDNKCPEWMCVKKSREMITKPSCKDCQRDFKTDWGLRKHEESRKNENHKVIYATYREITEPRCKWYDYCLEGRVND